MTVNTQVLVLRVEGESNEINEIDLKSLTSRWIPDNVNVVWQKENTGGVKKEIHIISFIYIIILIICIYSYHSSWGSSDSGASARGRRWDSDDSSQDSFVSLDFRNGNYCPI